MTDWRYSYLTMSKFFSNYQIYIVPAYEASVLEAFAKMLMNKKSDMIFRGSRAVFWSIDQ